MYYLEGHVGNEYTLGIQSTGQNKENTSYVHPKTFPNHGCLNILPKFLQLINFILYCISADANTISNINFLIFFILLNT